MKVLIYTAPNKNIGFLSIMRFCFLLFVIMIGGCKVKNDDGLAILPPDNVDGKYSTNHLITIETIQIGSTLTSGYSGQTIGKYQDPYMGTLQAEAYVQFLLSGTNVTFGDASKLTLDSLELWLYVTSYYGDSSEVAPIYIHEITQTFTNEESYYNHSTLATDAANLSLVNEFKIQLDTSGNFRAKVHKIRLDNSLGNKLLFANSSVLTDNTAFRDFFKGLKISSGHQNLMIGFDVITDSSRLVLYYKVQEDTGVASKKYNFYSDYTTAAKFTNYTRTSSGSLYEQVLNNQDQTIGFLSSGAQNQLYIKISMDSIQNHSVNKAELEIPVDSLSIGSNPSFYPPSIVYLYDADENKKITGLGVASASYDASKQMYVLTITNKINNYLRNLQENKGLILTPVFPGTSVNRAVILGPQNTNKRMRLKVYSTQIK